MVESEPVVKPKPRPIILIGMFLVDHSVLVSVLCFAAGIISLLLLPVLAKNTYISENALMPGSASSMLSNDEALEGNRFMNEILKAASDATDTGIKIPEVIEEYITQLGCEVSHHKFHRPLNNFHPLHFFLGPDSGLVQDEHSFPSHGVNTVGVLRAPRGDGKEAIVIVTPYNSSKITTSEALSLGVSYAVFSLLARVTWLAKDIVWLAADSKYGEYAAVVSWLRDYHSLSFADLGLHQQISNIPESAQVKREITSDGFRRAGTMAAALVIKVADSSSDFGSNVLNLYAEASNGQMPNLDLINIVNYLAAQGQGMRVQVDKILTLINSWWLNSLGQLIELLGKVARTLNPQWKFGISAADYVEGSATLASSLYNQALGVPTGPHGAFRDYQVDAITLEISPSFFSSNRVQFLLRVGRLVEGVIRSINNLLEKFHQSFFLYLLTGPNRFVSVGVYMIPFALLIAPLPLVAAALYSDSGEPGKDKNSNKPSDAGESKKGKDNVPDKSARPEISLPTFESWKWLDTAKTVLLIHLWSGFAAQLPYFISQIHNSTPSMNLLIWMALSVLSLFVTYTVAASFSFSITGPPLSRRWALLKSVTVASAFIGLCLVSVINFATAQIGALLLVPLCLTVVPLRHDIKANTAMALVRGVCNVLLACLAFLPLPVLLFKGASEGFDSMRLGELWVWAESLWAWNSATYIYMCIVHLPCWILCCHILLHSC